MTKMNFSELEFLMKDTVSKFKNSKKTSTELAQIIIDEYPDKTTGYNIQTISLMIYEIMSDESDPNQSSEKSENSISINSSEENKYDIINDSYIWESKRAGVIKISIKQADRLFYEYSQYGLNLSQEQVRRKHGFSIPEWNSIKSTLWLYKSSSIFSPYTLDNTKVNELQEMITDKLEMKHTDKNRLIEEEYRKHTLKQYKKVIRKYQIDQFASNEFLHELNSLLPETEIVKCQILPAKNCTSEHILVSVADLHIGAKTEGLKHTRDFDLEILKKRLDKVASVVNSYKSKTVTLAILGDLIESFSGLNHTNSWMSMEYGVHGAKVVYTAYEILSEFFNKINNLNNIKIIGGNHDRATADNKIDRKATIAELIFYMLKEKYSEVYDIEYSCLCLDVEVGANIKVLLSHGDRKIFKAAGTTLDSKVIEYGDANKFNVVLTGHLHSRGVLEDKVHTRWYKVPSIFSGNFYSEENGWNSQPGFFLLYEDTSVVQESDKRYPVVIDYPL